jgi:hypothetical protein
MEKLQLSKNFLETTREVKYGRIDNVVILIFPDKNGALEWVARLETETMLKSMKIDPKIVRRIG